MSWVELCRFAALVLENGTAEQAKGSSRNESTIRQSTYGHQIHVCVPFKPLVPNATGIALALIGGNILHQIGTAVRAQQRMITTTDRLSTFVAPAGLHRTPAFANTEDVTVRAGIPMATVSCDQVVSFMHQVRMKTLLTVPKHLDDRCKFFPGWRRRLERCPRK